MLSLRLPAVESDQAVAVLPLSEVAAEAFERALLAFDVSERQSELEGAFAFDANAASWALRLAELRTGRTINHAHEAAAILSIHLVSELAAALTFGSTAGAPSEVSWRLPRLVARIHALESQAAEFEKRLEHEKLESLKELAYGASHEINNPLANIAARAQTLLEDEANAERQRKLTAIHRQAMRAHEMIADLMLFARPPKLVLQPCDLVLVVETVVQELTELALEYEAELKCQPEVGSIEVQADATQLAVAIGAVVRNALEAVEAGGQVRVLVRQQVERTESVAEVCVRDDGPGLSDDVRRHMFDPFFSGREAGRGLGFGLSKCWRIVTDHGGEVFAPKCAGGAEFVIRLPRKNA